MRSNYPNCIAFALTYEGGRVDNPKDPGGRTNQGVTQATYDAYRRSVALLPRDVYGMEDVERDAIYRTGFWNKVKGDTLALGVDLAVFDWGVNSGPGRATAALKALGAAGTPLEHDPELVKALTDRRLSFMQSLRAWNTFKGGWTRRVAACEALGIQMAAGPDSVAVLQQHAVKARTKSAARTKAATGVTGGSVAAPAAIASHGGSWALVVIVGAATLIIAGLIAWKAFQHKARADALSSLAKVSS